MRFAILASVALLSLVLSCPTFATETRLKNAASLEPCVEAEHNEYLRLCNRFNTENGLSRCIAAGRDRYFARCALSLCYRFNTENGSIQCLEASRDKTYDMEEMQLCNRTTTEQGAVNCLASAGRRVRNPDNEDRARFEALLLDLRDELRTAERRLSNGDVNGAQRSIGWAIEDINRELERWQGQ